MVIIFHNITVLLYFWSNKYSLVELKCKKFLLTPPKNVTAEYFEKKCRTWNGKISKRTEASVLHRYISLYNMLLQQVQNTRNNS